ncbi:hypothetical protein ACN28C_24570 [Plantactinospora sp. WMMC1484]|uniref:hypothetical protein n=1 Tax=Plantactinospora sp. WMMC1484 TaxID=3404122 RepID=UPI003BF4EDA6
MPLKRLVRNAAATMAAAAIMGAMSFATPATAADDVSANTLYKKTVSHVEGQLETAPGNGAKGWLWIYVPGSIPWVSIQGGRLEWKDSASQTVHKMSASPGHTNVHDEWHHSITTWRVCALLWVDSVSWEECSSWS